MDASEVALDTLGIMLYGGLGLLIGATVSFIISVAVRIARRRRPGWKHFSRRLRLPQRIFLGLTGIGLGVNFALSTLDASPRWQPIFMQVFVIVLILSGAYVVTGIVQAAEDAYLDKAQGDEETPHFRRVRTQLQIIGKVVIAVVWICAVAGALLTFPELRAVGASVFASAGVLSVVAGLAAQSSLANMFAGMQLAFSDAIRVGDVIVFEESNGSIEEITLTYVVVRSWDDRRWIVPSSYFTTTAFENWTRREAKLLGTVEFDLDWTVPVEAMRVELMRLLRASDLWDRRTGTLQVTDAKDGSVRLRALVSAENSGDLWDLRCYVREELVNWLQHHAVYALPRIRLEPETTTAPPVEVRDDFNEREVNRWEAEQAGIQTAVMPSVHETDDDTAERSWGWLSALRQRLDPSSGGKASTGDPAPTSSEAPPLTPVPSSQTAEARLYSGSPEAERRRTHLAGPTAADMAERRQATERRLGDTQPMPAIQDDEEPPA